MSNESYLISQERCPSCASLGRDSTGDNLSIYSDGHSYCYGCGYYKNGSALHRFVSKENYSQMERHHVYLPSDSNIEYPQRALEWINQYELNRNDLLANNVVWSESKERLYFPVYGNEGLLAYQGRYFGNSSTDKKWWGKGDFKNIFPFYGAASRSLVLVEDVVSAVKLSRVTQSLWLSGNHVGADRWKRLFKLIPKGLQCIIWLDPDMYTKSIKEGRLGASYGLNTKSILSDKDPKEHSFEEIKRILNAD
jgi:hypothetical protein